MKKERFFPEDHRSFCNGPLSMNIDRFGGIESLHLLNIQNFNGKLYPARRPWKLFSRDGRVLNRPYICPAIRFLREYTDGAVRTFFPEYPDIHPSAVLSNEYNLSLRQDGFTIELCTHDSKNQKKFIATFTKAAYFEQTFENMSDYNQLAHEDVWLPPELHGKDFDKSKPFADSRIDLDRKEPVFDESCNALVFSFHATAAAFEKDIFFAVTAAEKLNCTEDCNQWMLKTDFTDAGKLVFSLGIAEDRQQSIDIAQKNLALHNANIEAHIAPDRFPRALKVNISDMPEASEFINVFPYYQRSLSLAESENELAIRAAANKYGFFVFWDHLFPQRDFLLCGETQLSRKCLHLLHDFPHLDTNPFTMIHLVIALNEHLAFNNDVEFLNKFMDVLKKSFHFVLTLTDPETGLIRYGLDSAVDVMPELGLNGLFRASCINGWWYDCCCVLINFAILSGDEEFAAEAAGIERKLAENYEKVFFDKKSGFLKAAVGENFEEMNCDVFLQTKTIAADYVHGAWLFRRIRRPMADYIMNHLHHPMGLSAVSYDSEAPAIYLKGTRMNQHLGHSCKLLRYADRADGVSHQLSNYLYAFKQTINAIETFNYCYCTGDQTQRADWQAFSASAAAQAIVHGKIGLAWNRGGLFFVPANDNAKCEIRNFHFRNRKYALTVDGSGSFAEISVNDKKIAGSMQLPSDILDDCNDIQITRTPDIPANPVLMWAMDAEISELQSAENYLKFRISNTLFVKAEFFVPSDAVMYINDQKADCEYNADNKRLWFSGIINANDLIEVKCIK